MKQYMKTSNISKSDISAVLSIGVFYLIMELAGITCPIKFITGISCAGCGMSRAWMSLIKLDPAAAFSYHPLFFLPPIMLLMYLFRKKMNQKLYLSMMILCVLAMTGVYFYRMLFTDSNIVVFEPENNIIAKLIKALNKLGG